MIQYYFIFNLFGALDMYTRKSFMPVWCSRRVKPHIVFRLVKRSERVYTPMSLIVGTSSVRTRSVVYRYFPSAVNTDCPFRVSSVL